MNKQKKVDGDREGGGEREKKRKREGGRDKERAYTGSIT